MKNQPQLILILAAVVFLVEGCGNLANPPARGGMVKDPATGLQFGSVVEKNIVTDASFFANKKIKVRTRNTSGDIAFNLRQFTNQLRSAYFSNGYEPTNQNDFGLLIDINVMYSGQIQSNLANIFGFLGAAGGGLAGYKIGGDAVGTAGGALAGVALGSIIGSYVTDDTYIIVLEVTFGVIKDTRGSKKTITFSRSPKYNDEKDDEEINRNKRGFKITYKSKIAVFAGGRNLPQSRIASDVRQRIIRIVGDII